MGKKLPLLLSTLTMLASGISSLVVTPGGANAEVVIPRDVSYWTFQEILDFEAEHDRLATEYCGTEDRACQRDFLFERLDARTDGRYNWLDYFKNNHFFITDIDPANETITLYFRDQNIMLWYMGIDNSAVLDEVYLAWVEEGIPDPRNNPFWENGKLITSYVADIRNGAMSDGIHKIFSGTSRENGDGWFAPNVEHQFSIAGSDLVDNTSHFIQLVVLGVTDGDMLGGVEYDSCYKFGYDGTGTCRIAFSSDGELLYLPSALLTSTSEPASDNTTPDSSDTNLEPADSSNSGNQTTSDSGAILDASTLSTSTNTTGVLIVADNREKPESSTAGVSIASLTLSEGSSSDLATESLDASSTAQAPASTVYVETPTASSGSCTEINFPWWLITLLVAGDAVAVWWFLPGRRNKTNK